MRRWINIFAFVCLAASGIAQETRIVDSLQDVLRNQEGRDKVLTMIELTWDFYDVSFDDCIAWGEKAIKEANVLGFKDLEAKANYVTGIQYAYHSDLDLAKEYLKKSYDQFNALSDAKNAFESLWHWATYELTMGNIDSAYAVYETAKPLAMLLGDTLLCANIISNEAIIKYKKGNLDEAFKMYEQAHSMFESAGDDRISLRMEYNMAIISSERGQPIESMSRCKRILPRFEDYGDYYALFSLCKNLGEIYLNDCIDYDSAMFYLEKAMGYVERPMLMRESGQLIEKEKSEAVVLMGDVLARQGRLQEALANYEEALRLAEKNAYPNGQMQACVGLGKMYAQMGQASKSLDYIHRYAELEKASGSSLMRPVVRKLLLMDYAHLGRFDDLESELDGFEEEHAALIRENADLQEQNRMLMDEASELLQNYETQGRELKSCQTSMLRYRLAFYGILTLLLLVLLSVTYWALRRKKSAKKEDKIEKG
ncbi:MAG: tetratricopeptide repeat protein [Bacteroidales bacterium]|nr:tetratricopeptide repeat protein [Bacteroidales bacterium]